MSTFKKAFFVDATIVILAVGVFFWQHNQSKEIHEELADLKTKRSSLEARRGPISILGQQNSDVAMAAIGSPRTVRDLLNASSEPLEAQHLVDGMMDVMMTQDMVGMIRLFIPLAELDHETYGKLVDEIQGLEGAPQTKEMALQLIGMFAPASNPQESIERLMGLGVGPHSYSNLISQWASDDPDAAYDWYQEKLEAGELYGKGTQNSPDQILLADLIGGIAKKDADRALDLFAEIEDQATRMRALHQMGNSLAAEMKESGDETKFLELVDLLDEDEKAQAVSSAMHVWGSDGSLDEGLAFVERHLEEPSARRSALMNMLMSHQSAPFEERADWLMEHTPSEESTPTVVQLVNHHSWSYANEVGEWLVERPRGEARDQGLQALANSQTNRGSFDDALNFAGKIEDSTTRQAAMERLGQRWMAANPEQARDSLPADVIKAAADPEQALDSPPGEAVEAVSPTQTPSPTR